MKLYLGVFICLTIGGFLFFVSIKAIKKNLDQKVWPKTTAEVLGTELKTTRIESSESAARLKGFRWVMSVSYSYRVAGEIYEGNRVTNASDSLISTHRDISKKNDAPPEFIAKFIEQHQSGTHVDVYYNPDNPKVSFVNYEPRWMRFIVFISISLFFLSLSVLFIMFGGRLGLK